MYALYYNWGFDHGCGPYYLSATYANDITKYEGPNFMFQDGFEQVTKILAEDLDIRFNKVVTKIDYSGSKVQITTTENRVYSADKVIVAVPLAII